MREEREYSRIHGLLEVLGSVACRGVGCSDGGSSSALWANAQARVCPGSRMSGSIGISKVATPRCHAHPEQVSRGHLVVSTDAHSSLPRKALWRTWGHRTNGMGVPTALAVLTIEDSPLTWPSRSRQPDHAVSRFAAEGDVDAN